MPSLNKVLLMGNLTRDPELRVTPKGTPICQFALAINRKFKMESGESREEVIYVDVVNGGIHLKPKEVHKLVAERGEEVVFFDGRNAFEAKIGSLKTPLCQMP